MKTKITIPLNQTISKIIFDDDILSLSTHVKHLRNYINENEADMEPAEYESLLKLKYSILNRINYLVTCNI